MSYRTYVNDVQIFGNNYYPDPWLEFISNQGIEIDYEGCYSGEVRDFNAMMEACEECVKQSVKSWNIRRMEMLKYVEESLKADPKNELALRKKAEFKSRAFDFSDIEDAVWGRDRYETLFDALYETVENNTIFAPLLLYHACEKLLIPDMPYKKPFEPVRIRRYKLKPGKSIKVQAC